jgi:hypothetical protein
MRPTAFKHRILATLIGAAWVLPAAFSFAAPSGSATGRFKDVENSMPGSALEELAQSSGSLADSWSSYASSSLKSNFSWANDDAGGGNAAAAQPPTIFTRTRSSWARTPDAGVPGASSGRNGPIHVAMQSARISDSALYVASSDAGSLLPNQAPGLQRTIVAPSFMHPVEDLGYWRFSLILAYQRFSLFAPMQNASAAFGQNGWAWVEDPTQLRYKENSAGFGTRVDFGGKFADSLEWRAGYQTRVEMDNFYSLRGLYGQPGSFDIPPSANVALDFSPTRSLRVSAEAERILYGQITPFAGYTLPVLAQQYLTAFGQSLEWQNLTVYSLAAAWRNDTLGEFALRVSTREQPLPTWGLLQTLIGPSLASRDWEADYAKAFDGNTTFHLRAVYAPLQMFGLPSYTADGNYGANRVRLEALLNKSF